jgi:hypothetical protein
MRGDIPPLPQYTFTAWCSVKAQRQIYLYMYLYLYLISEHGLRVLENRVLKIIFGPKR